MIHKLTTHPQSLFKSKFLDVRRKLIANKDRILIIPEESEESIDEADIYKMILGFDGEYRKRNNTWDQPKIKVVISK